MITEIIKINPKDTEKLNRAAKLIKNGETVAMPTETVYGLAASAFDENAVNKIFEAKGRPQDNPLIVHISDISQLYEIVSFVPDSLKKLANRFMPGPLTVVLPKNEKIPDVVTAGLPSVAVRMPSHETARAFISACGVPLAAPSANISGSPSPTSAKHVYDDLNGKIPMIIDGGECSVGIESTVLSLTGETPELLRPGGITLEQLQSVLGEVNVNAAVLSPVDKNTKACSPGMKYRHYSPKTKIIAVKGSSRSFADYVNFKKDESVCALIFEENRENIIVPYVAYGKRNDCNSQARSLFKSLREVDALGKEVCYAELPRADETGLAVVNRLLRAAGFSLVNLEKKDGGEFTVLGLTGKTGSGKSYVCEILKNKGAAIIDGDKLAREIVKNDKELLKELAAAFGNDIIKDGVLDRKLLASRAFRDKEGVETLNALTHPRITRLADCELSSLKKSGARIAVIDAAALIESGISEKCDILAVTYAPESVRLERIIKRDGITESEALLRMGAQKEDGFYSSKADYVIRCYSPYNMNKELEPLLKKLGL